MYLKLSTAIYAVRLHNTYCGALKFQFCSLDNLDSVLCYPLIILYIPKAALTRAVRFALIAARSALDTCSRICCPCLLIKSVCRSTFTLRLSIANPCFFCTSFTSTRKTYSSYRLIAYCISFALPFLRTLNIYSIASLQQYSFGTISIIFDAFDFLQYSFNSF